MAELQDDREGLAATLVALDGKSYGAYKGVKGRYGFAGWVLSIDYVQGDPFARPSRVRVFVPPETARLAPAACSSRDRRRATADFLGRRLAAALSDRSRSLGSGKSGRLEALVPGQEVLERTNVLVGEDGAVELRFRVGLPARGRRILGEAAAALICERLPEALAAVVPLDAEGEGALAGHWAAVEDAVALRAALERHGLVAFIADDAHLPRRSGTDDRPLEEERVVPFRAPDRLRVTLEAPNAGAITGLGIPEGVTLIVGGGYHGKSTLLRAIERGVYDHVPGDGRDRVVARADAVKVRAEDGRRVAGTDIANFIGALPGGVDTRRLETDNASGSTSQAAAIAEALELGCRTLLLDEDTCATNFMIRDARMQALVPGAREPIVPFIDRVRDLYRRARVSTVLVIGGVGDYFEVADTVIAMHEYLPSDVTAEAARIAAERPSGRATDAPAWREGRPRIPDPGSIEPHDARGRLRVTVQSRDRLRFGSTDVDLGALQQLVERAQTVALAQAVVHERGRAIDGQADFASVTARILDRIAAQGLDVIDPEPIGEYAAFRGFELAAFLNRLRTLRTRTDTEDE